MMMIFERFPRRDLAEGFATEVRAQFNIAATVYDTQEEARDIDDFPFALDPPIVLVERVQGRDREAEITAVAKRFGGENADS